MHTSDNPSFSEGTQEEGVESSSDTERAVREFGEALQLGGSEIPQSPLMVDVGGGESNESAKFEAKARIHIYTITANDELKNYDNIHFYKEPMGDGQIQVI